MIRRVISNKDELGDELVDQIVMRALSMQLFRLWSHSLELQFDVRIDILISSLRSSLLTPLR